MNFIVAQKNGPNGIVLVITDKDIVGKVFAEGKRQLDLSQKFYRGEEKNEPEVKMLMKAAYVIHFTGKASVALGINSDLIDGRKVLLVQGVPHAEVYMGE